MGSAGTRGAGGAPRQSGRGRPGRCAIQADRSCVAKPAAESNAERLRGASRRARRPQGARRQRAPRSLAWPRSRGVAARRGRSGGRGDIPRRTAARVSPFRVPEPTAFRVQTSRVGPPRSPLASESPRRSTSDEKARSQGPAARWIRSRTRLPASRWRPPGSAVRRRWPRGAILGANAPDVDVFCVFRRQLRSDRVPARLDARRAGARGLAVRAGRRAARLGPLGSAPAQSRAAPARAGPLLAVAALAVVSHPRSTGSTTTGCVG